MNKIAQEIKPKIKRVLGDLDMYSIEAGELVFRTGMAESGYRVLRQVGGGPAVGYFQVEPDTALDIWDNWLIYRPVIVADLLMATGCGNGPWSDDEIVANIDLQIALCRLHYRRKPGSIPKDIDGQAHYWKQWYNTPEGKGTVEHFLTANSET